MTEISIRPAMEGAGRWASALHHLYLVMLATGLVATAAAFPAGVDRIAVGVVTAGLAIVDVVLRRGPVLTERPERAVGYFLGVGVAVGVVMAVFPTYSVALFGLLPLAFARLPAGGAVVVGVVAVGLRHLVGPALHDLLDGLGWGQRVLVAIRPWTVYYVLDTIALPVLIGLFTAWAVHALRRQSLRLQWLVDQLSATQAELATASRHAGRAEERQRLAHELHDTLAQGLSGVVLQLEATEQELESRAGSGDAAQLARLAGLLARTRETAVSCLADTRRAVESLRPESLDDATLVEAVGQLCERWTELTGVPARCAVRGQVRRFPAPIEVVALRAVQEALANVGKHAGAARATVSVEYHAGELYVTVEDDGRGFDPAVAPRPNGHTSGGFGLSVMRERVASVGGALTVTSAPGAGATVAVTLPDGAASTAVPTAVPATAGERS